MSEVVRLLKGIMKTSGWTQEQVAMKMGVSYPTMNAWVNGKSKPRAAMMKRVRKLYLAQDITKDIVPTYVTLLEVENDLRVGDALLLEKDGGAIRVYRLNLDDNRGGDVLSPMRVADSPDMVIRGTNSAEQIYNRFDGRARAIVAFIHQKMAIARVVEWDYAKKGE